MISFSPALHTPMPRGADTLAAASFAAFEIRAISHFRFIRADCHQSDTLLPRRFRHFRFSAISVMLVLLFAAFAAFEASIAPPGFLMMAMAAPLSISAIRQSHTISRLPIGRFCRQLAAITLPAIRQDEPLIAAFSRLKLSHFIHYRRRFRFRLMPAAYRLKRCFLLVYFLRFRLLPPRFLRRLTLSPLAAASRRRRRRRYAASFELILLAC
jgi:hypothetical protein